MVHDDKEAGVTLHYVDEGTDTGPVISMKKFDIHKHESFYKVWGKTAHYSSNLLKKYFSELRKKKDLAVKQFNNLRNQKSQLFKFPTKKAFKKFQTHGKKLFHFKDFYL